MAVEDIEGKFKALRDAMNNQKVMPLVVGGNKVGSYLDGYFFIRDMPYTIENYNTDGSILCMTLTVELVEWNIGGPLEPGEHGPPKAVETENLETKAVEAKDGDSAQPSEQVGSK
jgi:hypothetical protein